MNQALVDWLITQGWALAGWVALLAAPFTVRYAISYLRAKAHSAKLDALFALAATAVTAAEQTLQKNPARKDAAMAFVQAALARRGINLPVIEIDAAIESAVLTELAHTDAPPTTTPPAPTGAILPVTVSKP